MATYYMSDCGELSGTSVDPFEKPEDCEGHKMIHLIQVKRGLWPFWKTYAITKDVEHAVNVVRCLEKPARAVVVPKFPRVFGWEPVWSMAARRVEHWINNMLTWRNW